jgi:molybdopterin molybdotransferase
MAVDMISYPDALQAILDNAVTLSTEEVDVSAALGRVNTSEIKSSRNLPSFRNSAMDGYAVRAADLRELTGQTAKPLQLLTTVYAGHQSQKIESAANTTVEVMTGALVDDAYDTVIPVEQIHSASASHIHFIQPPKSGANIRHVGEDFKKDTVVIPANHRITAEQIMALAALNIQKITVYRKAQVAIISTGKELMSATTPPDHAAMIYDSNGPYIQSWLSKCNLTHTAPIKNIYDDEAIFRNYLTTLELSATKTDIIISTGAVSAGKIDFIPKVLAEMGAKIIFHKVAIRPGKPILFAILNNGSYYFGLPGNPISAAIGLRFFVYPLIRKLCNLALEPPTFARLTADIALKTPLCFFLKATATINNEGIHVVDILPGQESFKISPLTQANVFAMLADGPRIYLKNELLPVYYFL